MYSLSYFHLFSPPIPQICGRILRFSPCLFLSFPQPPISFCCVELDSPHIGCFLPSGSLTLGSNSLLLCETLYSVKNLIIAFDNFWGSFPTYFPPFHYSCSSMYPLDPPWMPILSSQLCEVAAFCMGPLSCSGPQTALQQKAEMIWELASFVFFLSENSILCCLSPLLESSLYILSSCLLT